ncbi:uncharacterized protein EURHEDRAFT_374401 [Aspergillus ruber CBS 135680]|uniref:Uncharacterized protein n=1 Tax=Aspergillus ruber (strain CBS 135680) TaxID=1388766 RepID=A0A017SNA8_ASPRC|nr:uncharacterized protein EURHEDRAFT_374401 [Aspergillus ruber CBS 135680]EYE98296.1 hypothetical protein EURHEDRAFT_374401 [Aspergillus ruber CBS 135680]
MTLRVLSYAGLNDEGHGRWREGLARLLDSFKSLEILELRGYWPNRANTICRHAGLGELTSHVDEIPAKKRRVLKADFERSREWRPWDIPLSFLTTLAIRSKHPPTLTLHLELGLRDIKTPLRPSLSTINALRLGKLFFNARRQAGIGTSSSFRLILWTGRSYPCQGEPERDYTRFAEEYKARYRISLADNGNDNGEGVLEVRRVEGKSLDIREMAVNPAGVFRG